MTLAISPPPQPDSPLARLDARWRLAGVLSVIVATAFVRTPSAAAAAALAAALLAALARLPPPWLLERLGALAAALAVFTLPLPFLLTGPGQLWSWYGVLVAVVILLKAAATLTCVLVLLACAPLDVTLKAAHALRLPGLLVQLTLLTCRYVFVVADELARLRVALRVRGFRNRATRHAYRTVGQAAGTLLVRSAERAERVAQAMRCRGFDGRFRALAAFRTTPADVAAGLLLLTAAAGVVGLDVAVGGW